MLFFANIASRHLEEEEEKKNDLVDDKQSIVRNKLSTDELKMSENISSIIYIK
jgi:hypothetical protein